MSEFFQDLGDALRRVASNVGTEVSVAAQEQKLKDAYQTLGRMHYDAIRQGLTPAGEVFDTQMAKIRELIESIEQARRNQNVTAE